MLVDAARVLRDRGVDNIALFLSGTGRRRSGASSWPGSYGLRTSLFWHARAQAGVPGVLDALDVTLFSLRDISVFKYGLSCNKLFDYLASGRPVVACCGVRTRRCSASGGGICVPPESPEAVADALVSWPRWARRSARPWESAAGAGSISITA